MSLKIGDFIYNTFNYEKGEIRAINDNIVFVRWHSSTIHDVSYHNIEEIQRKYLNKAQLREFKINKLINT